MHRYSGQDFYVHEPTLIHNGQICLPIRWFRRAGKMWAKAWMMREEQRGAENGWVVDMADEVTFDEAHLVSSLPALQGSGRWTSFTKIFGMSFL